MSPAEILAKCGLTAEAVRKTAAKHASRINGESIAVINERKYGDLYEGPDLDVNDIHNRYVALSASTDNGECTTRRGTYRYWRSSHANVTEL